MTDTPEAPQATGSSSAALEAAAEAQRIDALQKKVADLRDKLDDEAAKIHDLGIAIARLNRIVALELEFAVTNELLKDIFDFKDQLEAALAKLKAPPPKPSNNKVGARKCGTFKAVCTAPSINKTPIGGATPPIPYTTTQDLSNSCGVVPTVKFNGDPAYVHNQSTQPSCKGDDPGTAGGVKSGTVNGEVKPVKGSTKVNCGGKPAVREGDPCTMNGGNNPGRYVTKPAPPAGGGDAIPPALQDLIKSADRNWQIVKSAHRVIYDLADDASALGAKNAALQKAQKKQAESMKEMASATKAAEKALQGAQGSQSSPIKLPEYQKPKYVSDNIESAVLAKLDLVKRLTDAKSKVALFLKEGLKLLESLKKAAPPKPAGGDGLKVGKK